MVPFGAGQAEFGFAIIASYALSEGMDKMLAGPAHVFLGLAILGGATSPVLAVDLLGKTVELRVPYKYGTYAPAPVARAHAFIYFAPDGTRFVYLDRDTGVELPPGKKTGRMVFPDRTFFVALEVTDTKISLERDSTIKRGRGGLHNWEVNLLGPTKCRVSKFVRSRGSSYETDVKFSWCAIIDGWPTDLPPRGDEG
jgi:hypothetical protein